MKVVEFVSDWELSSGNRGLLDRILEFELDSKVCEYVISVCKKRAVKDEDSMDNEKLEMDGIQSWTVIAGLLHKLNPNSTSDMYELCVYDLCLVLKNA